MNSSTKKWLLMKFSSVALIPLMLWFALKLASIYDSSYNDLLNFFNSQPSNFLFSLFIAVVFFFSALTISEIFEDYIHDERIKNVANKALYIFAIIMPIITISSIFILKI